MNSSTAGIPRRGLQLIVGLCAVLALLLGGTAGVAFGEPNGPGDEGGTASLRKALEAASKGHIEAKNKLDASKKRQTELTAQHKELDARVATLAVEVGVIASQSYRVGRLTPLTTLLNSTSPESFLERAAGLEMLAQRDGRKLRQLREALDAATRAQQAIDQEVREQKKQLAVLAKKKQDAERALAEVGGGASGGYVGANSSLAKPAPRNSDGSWPSESCSVNDPTTDGCITPRTLHAYNQARAAGYTRYTKCYRTSSSGEHPKGRACDFSAAAGGFENVSASGGDRTYGNNLAAYYVKNASRLGVLYVIWYRQIWMPSTGWRAYSGSGSPAADHTNHVHLSMY